MCLSGCVLACLCFCSQLYSPFSPYFTLSACVCVTVSYCNCTPPPSPLFSHHFVSVYYLYLYLSVGITIFAFLSIFHYKYVSAIVSNYIPSIFTSLCMRILSVFIPLMHTDPCQPLRCSVYLFLSALCGTTIHYLLIYLSLLLVN